MKKLLTVLALGLVFTACKNETKSNPEEEQQEMLENSEMEQENASAIEIQPISHATAVINWGDAVIYIDPVGGAAAFEGMVKPDFVLVTDIHGDHMSAETLQALKLDGTKIVVPKAVQEKLPENLQANLVVLNNGDTKDQMGFTIKAIPMYNLPEAADAKHVKGRGNGYVLEKDGERLYIAGDTEDIPEMRNLKNIDVALIPMNLPYTMPVDQAADGVLAFKPKKVVPYHYRGQDGFSDVEKFKKLVNEGNKDVEVELMEWYPNKGEQ